MSETSVVASRQGRIGHLLLNRPRALNALDLDMIRRMRAALDSTLETTGGNSNALYIDTNGQAIGIYPTDLGTAASPGGNTFKDSSSGNTRPLVYIQTGTGSTVTVPVSGNTWVANLQGANALGKYAVGTNAVGPSASDKNYYAGTGVTLNF